MAQIVQQQKCKLAVGFIQRKDWQTVDFCHGHEII